MAINGGSIIHDYFSQFWHAKNFWHQCLIYSLLFFFLDLVSSLISIPSDNIGPKDVTDYNEIAVTFFLLHFSQRVLLIAAMDLEWNDMNSCGENQMFQITKLGDFYK